ncbi:MAG: tyrosine-type recombinase/integrase, partial [Pseudomonadota bacterium]|nr:tyrosine-type recombinase/integrase [Pseudomonadota bacterium]
RRKAPRFLTEPQVEGLRQTVKKTSRNPHRDSTMILVAYRHGLRVGEVTDLRWEDVHLDRAEIYVRRLKSSKSTMHPLQGDELRALRKLRREKTSSLLCIYLRAGWAPVHRCGGIHAQARRPGCRPPGRPSPESFEKKFRSAR